MVTEPNRSGRRATALIAVLVSAVVGALLQVAWAGPASAADPTNPTVTMTMTKTSDKRINFRVDADRALSGTGWTMALWDTTTGARVAACSNTCRTDIGTTNSYISLTTVPFASTSELSAVAHTYVATIAADDSLTYPAEALATSASATADPWRLALTLQTLRKQLQFSAVANYSLAGSGYTLAIFDRTTGAVVKSCSTLCDGSAAGGYTSLAASTVPQGTSSELTAGSHDYVAVVAGVADAPPGANVAATSSVVTADPWAVTLSVTQNRGLLQLTAAANYSIPAGGYTLAIFDRTTGKLLKACNSGDTPCSGQGTSGYYYTTTSSFVPRGSTTEESGVAHEYVAVVAQDASALPGANVAATSAPVTSPPWKVTLSSTASRDGKSYSLTAVSNYLVTGSGYTLAIFDSRTGERVAVCGAGFDACSGTAAIPGYWLTIQGRTTGFTDSYVAVIGDDSPSLPGVNVAATSTSLVPFA